MKKEEDQMNNSRIKDRIIVDKKRRVVPPSDK